MIRKNLEQLENLFWHKMRTRSEEKDKMGENIEDEREK